MRRPLRAVLVGLGRIGATYADDAAMARYYQYATHSQVLEAHPAFEWIAATDLREDLRAAAARRWPALTVTEDVRGLDVDVAVLATGPEARLDLLAALPSIRGVLVEKPLGRTRAEAQRFVDACRDRDIVIQVCYWRRGDEVFRHLADTGLAALIGRPQAATLVYGNGLRNNGSHMIDFVRMLIGDIACASVPDGAPRYAEGPLSGDINVPFFLTAGEGVPVAALPVRFSHYRENAIDLWGERGRLSILQEGLRICVARVAPNRAMQDAHEVDSDALLMIPPTVGDAFYHLYSNFADVVVHGARPWSSAESALQTEATVDCLVAAASQESGTNGAAEPS